MAVSPSGEYNRYLSPSCTRIANSTAVISSEVISPAFLLILCLYASLGVQEYFQYDPTADYLNPQLWGAQLVDGTYRPLPLASTAAGLPYIHSAVLGLDLQLHPPYPEMGLAPVAQGLRFYDPQTGTKLLSRDELEQLREALQEENGLIQQERDAAQKRAEALAARLRELGIDSEYVA